MDLAQYRARVLDSYALVAYIPNPLGGFLDDLSRSLVPGSQSHAHVTVLPPRHLSGGSDEALEVLARETRTIAPFELQVSEIKIFDVTSVIYASIGLGRDRLIELHDQLNVGALHSEERFAFHPHVTLVIDSENADIGALAEEARRRWREFPGSRRFLVESFHFVHNVALNDWEEIAVYDLVGTAHSKQEC
ncbi:MAG: 2'-5' RNA ligase family protein [Bryobacterales bacterium]|nr:2'-5' RNA ligase family protein [Bryobacterales bacterium]